MIYSFEFYLAMAYNYRCDKILSINDELFSRVDFNVLFWDHKKTQKIFRKIFLRLRNSFDPLLLCNFWPSSRAKLNIFLLMLQSGLISKEGRRERERVF